MKFKDEINSNLSFILFTFIISFICLHLYHNNLLDLVFFAAYLIELSKNIW